MANLPAQQLTAFAEQVLRALGIPAGDAQLTARLLIRADLNGYPTHGIGILPEYVQRARDGVINLAGRPQIIHDGKATAQIDGQLYLGQVVGTRAMSLAMDKAVEHGVGAVSARNSAHFGRLADYVELSASAGLVGMAFVSVGGASIATFGSGQATGNSNPIAVGIPASGGESLIFDFTTAALSMREIARRGSRGEPLPAGTLIDHEGNPTTDYGTFSGPPRGAALPFGGHKGSGLHLVAEVLGGVLSGHGTGLTWAPRGGPAINGGLFLAMDVAEFMPPEDFRHEVGELASFLRSRKPAAGNDAVRLPGDGARARAAQRSRDGIPLEDATLKALRALAEQLQVPPPA
jgi:uncharacterized oxidoreductase